MKKFIKTFIRAFLDERQTRIIITILRYTFYIFIIIHYLIGVLYVVNTAIFNSLHEIIISYVVIIVDNILTIFNKFFDSNSITYIPNAVIYSYNYVKSEYEESKNGFFKSLFLSWTPLEMYMLEILGGEISMVFLTIFFNMLFK